MITSKSNARIKWLRRLQSDRRFRRTEGLFVVEGTRWMGELARLSCWPSHIFVTESWLQGVGNQDLLDVFPSSATTVSDVVMDHTSTMEAAPGVVAVLQIPERPLPLVPTFLLILDGIRNPGNLGSLLRTAAAAGVDAVVLAPGCVDPYNPKVLRGGMGAQLKVPVVELDWSQIGQYRSQLTIYLASASNGAVYNQVDWRQPAAIIIGSESDGPGPEAHRISHSRFTIPMHADVESLNAAVAAGIALFEVAHQRAGYS